ncbi:hypothetical protein ABK040_000518 [Willaertia magna]
MYQEDDPIISYLKYRTICKDFKYKFERLVLEKNRNCLNLFYLTPMDHFGIKYEEAKGRYLFTYCLLRSLIEEEKKELKRENTELFDINFIKEFNDLPKNNVLNPFGFQPSICSTTPSLFGTATITETEGTTEDNGDDEVMNDTTPNINNNIGFNFGSDNSTGTLNAFTFGGTATIKNTNNSTTTTNGFNFTATGTSDNNGDNNIGAGFNFGGNLNNTTNAFNFNQTTAPSNNGGFTFESTSNDTFANNNNNGGFTFGTAVTNDNNVGFSFGTSNNNANLSLSGNHPSSTFVGTTTTTNTGFETKRGTITCKRKVFNNDDNDNQSNNTPIKIPKDVNNISKEEEHKLVEKLKAANQSTIPHIITENNHNTGFGFGTFSSEVFNPDFTISKAVFPVYETNDISFYQHRLFSIMKDSQQYLESISKLIINCQHFPLSEASNLLSLFINVEHIVVTGTTLLNFALCLINNNFNEDLKKLEKLEILIPPTNVTNQLAEAISSKLTHLKYLIIYFDVPDTVSVTSFGFGMGVVTAARTCKTFNEEFKELPSQLNNTDNELYVFIEPLHTLTEKKLRKLIKEYHYSPLIDNYNGSLNSFGSLICKIICAQTIDKIEQKNMITYLMKEERIPVQYSNLLMINNQSVNIDFNIFEYLIYLSKQYNYYLLIEHEYKPMTSAITFGTSTSGVFNKELFLQSLIFGWREGLFQSLLQQQTISDNITNIDNENELNITEYEMDQLLIVCALDDDIFTKMISFIKNLLEKNNQIKKIFNSFQFHSLLRRLSNLGKWNHFYKILQLDKYVLNFEEIFNIKIGNKYLLFDCLYNLSVNAANDNALLNNCTTDSNPYLICINELIERTPTFIDQIFTSHNDNILQFVIKLLSKQLTECKVTYFGGIYILKKLLKTIVERGEEKEILKHKNAMGMTSLHLCCASKLNSDSLFFTKRLLKVGKAKMNDEEYKEWINETDK